jgi:hypothetical protein
MSVESVLRGPIASPAHELSGVRTVLFGALAVVWFVEMVFLGFQSFSSVWTRLWQVVPPADPRLLTALSTTWAVAAPAKGALCVMAVIGLRSRNPAVRTALFASMALVPPLNIAFPFRQQGFLPGPVTVATVLSCILWGSFFLFRERTRPSVQGRAGRAGRLPRSGWEVVRFGWFAANSAALTLMALRSLFWPAAALHATFPCLAGLFGAPGEELSGLIHSDMASGTHLLALATASWIATLSARGNPVLRTAVAAASAVHAGLMGFFPLKQILLEDGVRCAMSSMLVLFVPLFVGWLLYLTLSGRVQPAAMAPLSR